ncbi:MarR family winged helix-turn-helix transcriptional regulator [Rhizobium sp. RM]|uniref:MarR family winged helix-turn-helix transcriptional regulator n=1 Tax=Rhizobium sp. RM TaxID=2748079 RepID=UPI0015B70C5E|nr:MarR family winged helix-turn-helix transcriptional regulator [Rhizobium sp. RM]NWJ25787.1 winged helix-turn-helix transcriptional regulator [Rhizobium sp. RM]
MGIFTEEAEDIGFSPTQFSALAFVQIEPGIQQNMLGERIALDRSSVTKCVEILEARELITRTIDPSDKRARLLHITPAGIEVLDQLTKAAARARARIEASMGKDQFQAFLKSMNDFVAVPASEKQDKD